MLIGKDLSTDRNTDVHCHFEKFDKSLAPGTYMNAEVQSKNHNADVLLSDAIVQFEGKQYVFNAIGNQRYRMTEVNLGETENRYTQIVLPATINRNRDLFVTKNAYSLLMAMKNEAERS